MQTDFTVADSLTFDLTAATLSRLSEIREPLTEWTIRNQVAAECLRRTVPFHQATAQLLIQKLRELRDDL